MQNENINPDANSSAGSAPAQPMTEQVKEAAKVEMQNVAKGAQEQLSKAGEAATQQVGAVGQAAAQQVQNIGQAGVNKVGEVVGQMMKPDLRNQPPVSSDEKVYATIAYIPFVALVSIVVKPDSAYVRLHSKQGLLLSLLFFFVGFLAVIVSLFPAIGGLLAALLGLVPLGCLAVGVYSMYLAASGFWWKIPVLSAVADLIPVEWMAKTSKENITGQMGVAKNDYDNRADTLKLEKSENQVPVQNLNATQQVPQGNVSPSGTPTDTTPKA